MIDMTTPATTTSATRSRHHGIDVVHFRRRFQEPERPQFVQLLTRRLFKQAQEVIWCKKAIRVVRAQPHQRLKERRVANFLTDRLESNTGLAVDKERMHDTAPVFADRLVDDTVLVSIGEGAIRA